MVSVQQMLSGKLFHSFGPWDFEYLVPGRLLGWFLFFWLMFSSKSERHVQGRLPRMSCHMHWCRLLDVSDRWTWLRRVRVEQGRRQPLSSQCWVGWMSVRTTHRSVTPGWGAHMPACMSVCLLVTICLVLSVFLPVCLAIRLHLLALVCLLVTVSVIPCLSFCLCVSPSVCTCQPLPVCLSVSDVCCSVFGCICHTMPAYLPMYDRQLYAAAPCSSFAVVIYGGPLFWDHEHKNQPKNGL